MPRADARGRTFAAWLATVSLLAACTGGGASGHQAPATGDEVTAPAPALDDEPPEPEPEPEPDPPPPSPPPPPPVSRDGLIGEAASLLSAAEAAAEGGDFSALVIDEHGREVLAHRADEALMPASTLKIVTAAAALSTFGPDATFGTRLEVTAPIGVDGVVHGDLVLIGSGDPVLATEEYARWVYPARPRTPLEDLADAVVASGVSQLRGDLVGVADGFDGPNVATGWPDRYFSSLDARYLDGLSVDAGLRTILSYPESVSPDDTADVDDVDDDERGPDEDADDAPAAADDDPEQPQGLSGTVVGPPGVDPVVRVDHTADPAAHAAGELGRLLVDRGVEVLGEARSGAPSAPSVGRLARIESPPLEELLRFAVQRSDNQITDAIFRAVGRARTGTGSFASGDRALRQVLDRYGIAHTDARFADGSGLSRDDRATTRLLVELERTMSGSRHATTWSSLMAVTGRSGTLESRLENTVADGRFAGKTGTLRDVNGIVGTVHGDGSRRYHLSVIANDAGAARWVSRALTDELIVLLVADLDGCPVGTSSVADGALARPPLAVSC